MVISVTVKRIRFMLLNILKVYESLKGCNVVTVWLPTTKYKGDPF